MDILGESTTSHAYIDTERCIAELQRGRAIALTASDAGASDTVEKHRIVQLVENMSEPDLATLIAEHTCQLILSRPRALALGLMVDSNAVCFELNSQTSATMVRSWAGLTPASAEPGHVQTSSRPEGSGQSRDTVGSTLEQRAPGTIPYAKAALNMARYAHALPAFIMHEPRSIPANMLSVSVQSALEFSDRSGELIKLSTAGVPLAAAKNVQLTVFRERHGFAEHVAITVGQPDFSKTVTVRIHSSCFTGDILGSMKCDCGEQLDRAISKMAEGDGGVVLYLSQEGRGIGLANKLLAYQLQDQGLDTIEANQHLGFDADQRCYQAALYILQQLGINSVRLMTNNPLKIDALRQQGVHVEERLPSPATENVHNARYLQTKRERAGHLTSCDNAG